MLGKRMAVGYYRAPKKEALDTFFDNHDDCAVEGRYIPDLFTLEYEMGRE